jgi:hypothetical protein
MRPRMGHADTTQSGQGAEINFKGLATPRAVPAHELIAPEGPPPERSARTTLYGLPTRCRAWGPPRREKL